MIKSLRICHNGDNFMQVRLFAKEIVRYAMATCSIIDGAFYLIMKREYYFYQ